MVAKITAKPVKLPSNATDFATGERGKSESYFESAPPDFVQEAPATATPAFATGGYTITTREGGFASLASLLQSGDFEPFPPVDDRCIILAQYDALIGLPGGFDILGATE